MKESPIERYLAMHRDVLKDINVWAKQTNHQHIIPKLMVLCKFLLRGAETEVRITLRQLKAMLLKSSQKTLELKHNGRGGAARLFLLRACPGEFFLASGVEKSEHGCRAIPAAISREAAVLKRLEQDKIPTSGEALKSYWSPDYTIVTNSDELEALWSDLGLNEPE